MSEQEQFFFGEAVRLARCLNQQEKIMFLEGMITAVGEQHPARGRLIAARNYFNEGDTQLELLQLGQLKMEELLQS